MDATRGPRSGAPPRRPERPYPFAFSTDGVPKYSTQHDKYSGPKDTPESRSDSRIQGEQYSQNLSETPLFEQSDWPLPAPTRPRPAPVHTSGRAKRSQNSRQRRRDPQNPGPGTDRRRASFAEQHPYDWQYYRPPPSGSGAGHDASLQHHPRGPPPAYSAPPPRQKYPISFEGQRHNGAVRSRSQRSNTVNRNPIALPPTARRGSVDHRSDPVPVHSSTEDAMSIQSNLGKVNETYRPSSRNDSPAMRFHCRTPSASAPILDNPNFPPHHPSAIRHPAHRSKAQEAFNVDESDSSASISAIEMRHGRQASHVRQASQGRQVGHGRQASHGKRTKPDLTIYTGREPLKDRAKVAAMLPGHSRFDEEGSLQPVGDLRQHPAFRNDPGRDSPRNEAVGISTVAELPHNTPEIREPEPESPVAKDLQRTAMILPDLLQPKAHIVPERGADNRVGTATPLTGNDFLTADDFLGPEPTPVPTSKKASKHLSSRLSARWSTFWSTRGSSHSRNSSPSWRSPSPHPGEKERSRPIAVDMATLRELEDRVSASSLSDLIRRATRLATNLESGRTASRFGHSWFIDTSSSNEEPPRKSADQISIPATFVGCTAMEEAKEWPRVDRSEEASVVNIQPRRRQCCGMPVWAFTLLMLVVLILTAGAVIIPVLFLVIKPFGP